MIRKKGDDDELGFGGDDEMEGFDDELEDEVDVDDVLDVVELLGSPEDVELAGGVDEVLDTIGSVELVGPVIPTQADASTAGAPASSSRTPSGAMKKGARIAVAV